MSIQKKHQNKLHNNKPHKFRPNKIWAYGIHSIEEILKTGGREIHQVLCATKTEERLNQNPLFARLFKAHDVKNIAPHEFENALGEHVNHQSIAIEISSKNFQTENELLIKTPNRILILDELTDVGNVGAIIRSAVAFNVFDIVVTSHNGISDSGALIKASAGMSEQVNFFEVNNLNKLIDSLKKKNIWCIGLDGGSKSPISEIKKFDKLALILGSEGKGIRPLIKKHCDLLLKIPTNASVESLNVSTATAIALYESNK